MPGPSRTHSLARPFGVVLPVGPRETSDSPMRSGGGRLAAEAAAVSVARAHPPAASQTATAIAPSHATSTATSSVNKRPSRIRLGSTDLCIGSISTGLNALPGQGPSLVLVRVVVPEDDAISRGDLRRAEERASESEARVFSRSAAPTSEYAWAVRSRKPRLTDEPERHDDRLSLFRQYATGQGPVARKGLHHEEVPAEEIDADARAAERLLLPGDHVWPPELVRLYEALARARGKPR